MNDIEINIETPQLDAEIETSENEIEINPVTPTTEYDHSAFDNLDYEHSGHTGFASQNELNQKASITYVDDKVESHHDATKQDKIDESNPLNADKVVDGVVNKVFTSSEKTKLGTIENGAEKNVQADWNESDNTKDDYIKNKPTIPSKTSDLLNDSNFITKAVGDLANYYLKSETYTKSEVESLISSIAKLEIVYVETLPEASESTLNKIYLVPSEEQQEQNTKDEFITIRSGSFGFCVYAWEQIGSTAIDLSNYVTITVFNQALATKQDLIDYLHKLSADLIEDGSTNKVVSQTEKNTWNAKSNFSGNYEDLNGKPTIPEKTSDLQNDSGFLTQHQDISGKQDKIDTNNKLNADLVQNGNTNKVFTSTDKTKLDDIENGAEKNVQSDWDESNSSSDSYIKNKPNLSLVAESGNYNDLNGKPTIPSKTSDLTNDSNFVESNELSSVAYNGDYDDLINKPAIPEKTSDLTNDSDFVAMDDLSSVAFSGSYNDLLNKPSIPSGITEIATQYTRLTDLDSGVYKLTYNGQKYLYYNGTSGTTYSIINTSSRHCVLYVTKYGSGSPYYWYGYYFTYNGSSRLMYQFYTSESLGSGSTTSLNLGNVLTSIPTNYKTVPNSTYATYSSPIYNSNNTFGTSSYSLNLGAFANAGLYTFTIDANSSSTYGCPYTPSASRRACLVTIGDYNYSSSYGGYRAIQDFYCVDDDKHYQRYVTKNSYSYTFGAWRDMNASSGGGTQFYRHLINVDGIDNMGIVSTRSTAYTSWSQVSSDFNNYYISSGNVVLHFEYRDSMMDAYGKVLYMNSNNINYIDDEAITWKSLGSISSDTVTEL